MPFAILGRRVFRRSRYTSVQSSVGTWTFDFSTRMPMKASSDGIADGSSSVAVKSCFVGVAGGEARFAGAGPHWMTSTALAAR